MIFIVLLLENSLLRCRRLC